MSHLRAAGVRSFDDKSDTDQRVAVWTARPHRVLVKELELILLEPHQPETFWTASDLRSHNIPLTLLFKAHLTKGRII